MANKFNFERVKAAIEQTKRTLPLLLAKQAENYFTDSFKKQQLGPTKWAEVQRRIPGTFEYRWPARPKASSRTRPIMIGTGNLRRKVSRSIHEATWDRVRLVVDLPYAKIHNEGGKAGRNHSSTIPARPYMKHTAELGKMQTKLITTTTNKIWK